MNMDAPSEIIIQCHRKSWLQIGHLCAAICMPKDCLKMWSDQPIGMVKKSLKISNIYLWEYILHNAMLIIFNNLFIWSSNTLCFPSTFLHIRT